MLPREPLRDATNRVGTRLQGFKVSGFKNLKTTEARCGFETLKLETFEKLETLKL